MEPLRLRPKAVALLAYLALSDQSIRRDELARLLFPEAQEPLASLRWYLSHLRSSCPSSITSTLHATREDIGCDVPTDIALFCRGTDRLLAVVDAVDASGVLALYRDDLLAGLSISGSPNFDTWLYIEQESLRRRFRQATTGFARAVLSTSRVHEAIKPLSRLVSVDPYCEDGHVLLIEACEVLERSEQARAVYHRYQRAVRQDLRAEPRSDLVSRYEGSSKGGQPLPAEQLVSLRDVTIHVVDWQGREPTIIGIHGSGMLAHSLDSIAQQLAPDHRFVAVDLRGHGFSDKPRTGYELEYHVDDLVQLTEELDLHDPLILGHSAGGAIATFLATQVNAAGLILLDGTVGDRAFTENAASRITPWIDHLDGRFSSFESYLAGWRSGRPSWQEESERMLDRWVHYLLAPLPNGTYRPRLLRDAIEAEWESIVTADSLGELSRVRCPTLIILAMQPFMDDHPYLTRPIADAQVRAARHPELFIAWSSSHGTMVRDPEPEMIEAIRDFLERCVRKRGESIVQNA